MALKQLHDYDPRNKIRHFVYPFDPTTPLGPQGEIEMEGVGVASFLHIVKAVSADRGTAGTKERFTLTGKAAQGVNWNQVGGTVSVDNTTGAVSKAGFNQSWTGAYSDIGIPKGTPGKIVFNVNDASKNWIVGLQASNKATTTSSDVSYGMSGSAGVLYVSENTVLVHTDSAFVATDILSVECDGTTVRYKKNGVTFYTSVQALPNFDLYPSVSLYETTAAVTVADYSGILSDLAYVFSNDIPANDWTHELRLSVDGYPPLTGTRTQVIGTTTLGADAPTVAQAMTDALNALTGTPYTATRAGSVVTVDVNKHQDVKDVNTAGTYGSLAAKVSDGTPDSLVSGTVGQLTWKDESSPDGVVWRDAASTAPIPAASPVGIQGALMGGGYPRPGKHYRVNLTENGLQGDDRAELHVFLIHY